MVFTGEWEQKLYSSSIKKKDGKKIKYLIRDEEECSRYEQKTNETRTELETSTFLIKKKKNGEVPLAFLLNNDV